ncbi:MAG: hypothetical protein QXE81_00890 [Desulfurococcaceae archaeon]
MVTILNDSSNKISTRGIFIEIPLKPHKKMISIRIDEEALLALDKFITATGEYTRTLLITKVIEALAKGLKETNYSAFKLELKFFYENPSGTNENVSIIIPLRSGKRST